VAASPSTSVFTSAALCWRSSRSFASARITIWSTRASSGVFSEGGAKRPSGSSPVSIS
jgi:hypothetical protein